MMKRICLLSGAVIIASGLLLFWGWGLAQASQVVAVPASSLSSTEDSLCAFQAITVTAAHLGVTPGISDTHIGSAEDRLIYIANHQSGVLTVTAAVSAPQTTPCYLWGGAAFGQTANEFVAGVGHTYWLTYTIPASQSITPLLPVSLVLTSSWSTTGTTLVTLSHQVRLTLAQDIDPPQIALTAPLQISATVFTVAWSVQDAESGVASYTVAYSGTGYTDWQLWMSDTEQVSATFTVQTFPGTYRFRVMACDHIGNCGDSEKTTQVAPIHIYLPLVLRHYAAFSNGDFESGSLYGWQPLQGGFPGYGGSGLPQQVAYLDENRRALLGEPEAVNNAIPVGYGAIAQTFTVNKPYLELQYRVFSYDLFKGANNLYYDTFEVSIDQAPVTISDTDRNTQCTELNPTGVLSTSTGLIFCGGRSGVPTDLGKLWDSGWQTVTLDLADFQNQNMTIYFSVWSREYSAPGYDDRGWYNTWVYIDNIKLKD